MGVKVVVREGEPVEQALRRLNYLLIRSHDGEKWPYSRSFYAKPNVVRHRKKWIKRARRKYAVKLLRRWGFRDWCGDLQRQLAKR